MYIVYKARDKDIFSASSLAALKGLHHALADYRLDLPDDEASPLNHPDYPLIYLSRDCQYGGIVIRTDFNTRIKRKITADSDATFEPDPGPVSQFETDDLMDAIEIQARHTLLNVTDSQDDEGNIPRPVLIDDRKQLLFFIPC